MSVCQRVCSGGRFPFFTRMAPSYRFNVYAVFDVLKMFNFKSGLAMFLGSEGLRVVIGRLSL